MKASQVSARTLNIIQKAALPDAERLSLASVVTELGNQSVPLNLKVISITAGGRFQVEFSIDPSVLPSGNESQHIERNAASQVAIAIRNTKVWE